MEPLINRLEESELLAIQNYLLISKNPQLKSLIEDIETIESKSNNQKIKEKIIKTKETSKVLINKLIEKIKLKETTLSSSPSIKKPIKIYIDGVFDIVHSGHFNALRQAKKLGDILVLGINSDSDVEKIKGPTLMNVHERAALSGACKWVDIVVEDTPYTPTLKLLDELDADFSAHGDDIAYDENGKCVYDEIINAGRMKFFKRTEGVSTTEIIGRLLISSKDYAKKFEKEGIITSDILLKELGQLEDFQKNKKPVMSSFLATSWRVSEFSNNRVPKEGDKIVYIDGVFDILHIAHIETLKKAKELGDFLYVGVHDDDTVSKYRGNSYPILNLNERVFNLLALKYVDEVIIGAPYKITGDMIKKLKLNVVVQAKSMKNDKDLINVDKPEDDPYEIPKKNGLYQTIESEYDLTNEILVQRIIKNREMYIKKYLKKAKKDEDFFDQSGKEEVKEI